MPVKWRTAALLIVSAASLAACGKPEDQSYSSNVPVAAKVSTALPAYPAWSTPMIGKLVSQVLSGRGQCKGTFDVVLARHGPPRPGVEVGGWAFDVAAKQAVQHVLLVNAADRIVGAAQGGVLRTDVSDARSDITSKTTGWKGVAGATTGTINAVGVTNHNAACDIGPMNITDNED